MPHEENSIVPPIRRRRGLGTFTDIREIRETKTPASVINNLLNIEENSESSEQHWFRPQEKPTIPVLSQGMHHINSGNIPKLPDSLEDNINATDTCAPSASTSEARGCCARTLRRWGYSALLFLVAALVSVWMASSAGDMLSTAGTDEEVCHQAGGLIRCLHMRSLRGLAAHTLAAAAWRSAHPGAPGPITETSMTGWGVMRTNTLHAFGAWHDGSLARTQPFLVGTRWGTVVGGAGGDWHRVMQVLPVPLARERVWGAGLSGTHPRDADLTHLPMLPTHRHAPPPSAAIVPAPLVGRDPLWGARGYSHYAQAPQTSRDESQSLVWLTAGPTRATRQDTSLHALAHAQPLSDAPPCPRSAAAVAALLQPRAPTMTRLRTHADSRADSALEADMRPQPLAGLLTPLVARAHPLVDSGAPSSLARAALANTFAMPAAAWVRNEWTAPLAHTLDTHWRTVAGVLGVPGAAPAANDVPMQHGASDAAHAADATAEAKSAVSPLGWLDNVLLRGNEGTLACVVVPLASLIGTHTALSADAFSPATEPMRAQPLHAALQHLRTSPAAPAFVRMCAWGHSHTTTDGEFVEALGERARGPWDVTLPTAAEGVDAPAILSVAAGYNLHTAPTSARSVVARWRQANKVSAADAHGSAAPMSEGALGEDALAAVPVASEYHWGTRITATLLALVPVATNATEVTHNTHEFDVVSAPLRVDEDTVEAALDAQESFTTLAAAVASAARTWRGSRWACTTTGCAAPDLVHRPASAPSRAVLDELYRLLHAHQAVVTHAALVEAQLDTATQKTWPLK